MKNSPSSVSTHQIARALLLTFAATAACTFISACVGTAYRHQDRVEDRVDRRVDRRYDRVEDRVDRRVDRRYDRWD